MDMPGFAAAASLYASRGCYYSRMPRTAEGQVVPQLSISCAIKAGLGMLKCAGGPLDQDACAHLAEIEYSVCEFLEATE